MNKNMRNKIFFRSSIIFLGILSLIASFVFSGTALAANPQFNNASDDIKTLVVGNWTTNGGTKNWGNSLSVNSGDRIAFDIYYHNTIDGTVATNTKIKLNYPTSKTSGFTVTATIVADNATQITDTATINMSTAQTFDFESSAKWYQNEQVSTFQNISLNKIGNNTIEVNLGNVDNKWGHVVFYANVSSDVTPPPVCVGSGCNPYPPYVIITPTISVNAGNDLQIEENQSATLQGYAYDSGNYPMTYSWSCTGGTLSNTNDLRPTFYAPSVSNNINVICTLTVTDTFGVRSSDSLNILVKNSASDYYYYYTTPLTITTNNPESVTTNSAILKATLNNDGGYPMSVRFVWGDNSYINNSYWITGKHSGDAVTYNLTGLQSGKGYQYRVEATNNNGTVYGQNVVFVTKPEGPNSLYARSISSSQINLSWNKGVGSCYTRVVRKAYSYPTSINDGATVYYGYDKSFVDSRLASGTTYYYRAWSIACDKGVAISDQYSQAYARTLSTYVPVTPTVTTDSGVILEFLARNATEKENAWQDSVSAKPGDEIEFYVVVTPTGTKNLNNVNLRSMLSSDIGSITDLQVNGNNYTGSVSTVNIGTASLGESTVVAFKGVVAAKENFSYGKNILNNRVEVLADNVDAVEKSLNVSVERSLEAGAGIIEFLGNGLGLYAVILTLIVFILIVVVIYLIVIRKK